MISRNRRWIVGSPPVKLTCSMPQLLPSRSTFSRISRGRSPVAACRSLKQWPQLRLQRLVSSMTIRGNLCLVLLLADQSTLPAGDKDQSRHLAHRFRSVVGVSSTAQDVLTSCFDQTIAGRFARVAVLTPELCRSASACSENFL